MSQPPPDQVVPPTAVPLSVPNPPSPVVTPTAGALPASVPTPPPAATLTEEKAEPIDPRDVELLTNKVAEQAIERIVKWVRWPLAFVAVFATYTGYNIWSDIKTRSDNFQKNSEQKMEAKLEALDQKADRALEAKLTATLERRDAEMKDLRWRLNLASGDALVEVQTNQRRSKETADRLNDLYARADKSLSELDTRLKEFKDRSDVIDGTLRQYETKHTDENLSLIRTGKGGLLAQDAFKLIQVAEAIAEAGEGKPVRVAILSTGVTQFPRTPDGESLQGRILESKSFVGEALDDVHGYGTQLTSLVAAIAPKAEIIIVKVLDNQGVGPISSIVGGLEFAIQQKARVVIIPLGARTPPLAQYERIFEVMSQQKIIALCPVGNGAQQDKGIRGQLESPASNRFAVAVTATSLKDGLLPFANTGPRISFAAPGQDIVTIGPGGTYTSLRGTGPATAISGGVAALILSVRPELDGDDVTEILKQSAKKLPLGTDEVGAGRIDALAAVKLAKTYQKPKPK